MISGLGEHHFSGPPCLICCGAIPSIFTASAKSGICVCSRLRNPLLSKRTNNQHRQCLLRKLRNALQHDVLRGNEWRLHRVDPRNGTCRMGSTVAVVSRTRDLLGWKCWACSDDLRQLSKQLPNHHLLLLARYSILLAYIFCLSCRKKGWCDWILRKH